MTDTLILRTRPSTVEARQVTADQDARRELALWVGGWTYGMTHVRWYNAQRGQVVSAGIGEWIVRGPFGEHEPVSDSALFAQYERVLPEVAE